MTAFERAFRSFNPAAILRRDPKGRFELSYLPAMMDVTLSDHGEYQNIKVVAEHDGWCYDFIYDNDVYPIQSPLGWRCKLCTEGEIVYYPSREKLWREHCFKPLYNFLDNKAAKSEALGFYGAPGESTFAQLGPVSRFADAFFVRRLDDGEELRRFAAAARGLKRYSV